MKTNVLILSFFLLLLSLVSCNNEPAHIQFKDVSLGLNINEFVDSLHKMGYQECDSPTKYCKESFFEIGDIFGYNENEQQMFFIGKYAKHKALLCTEFSELTGGTVISVKLYFPYSSPDVKSLSKALQDKYKVEPEYNHDSWNNPFTRAHEYSDSYDFKLSNGSIYLKYSSVDGLYMVIIDKLSSSAHYNAVTNKFKEEEAAQKKALEKKKKSQAKSMSNDI